MCLSGCGSCSSTNISVCLSCLAGTYLNSDNVCTICPTGCLTCSSKTICLSCNKGFQLSNNTCVTGCVFPCATCDNKFVCLTCFGGYSFFGGSCINDTSCSTNNSCVVCPLGYSLSNLSTCVQCTAQKCHRCDPTAPATCKLCASGNYL